MSSTAILSDLAPSGVMRAAINIGNPILAAQEPNRAIYGALAVYDKVA